MKTITGPDHSCLFREVSAKARRNRFALLAGLALFFFFTLLTAAAYSLEIDAERQLQFAEHLFETGRFQDSAAEYRRFIYFFPSDPRVEEAMYRIGMAQFEAGRFRDAVSSFESLIEKSPDTPFAQKSYLKMAEAYRKLDEFGSAATTLNNLLTVTGDPDVRDEADYRLGWIAVETASFGRARSHFERIRPENRDKYRVSRLLAELDREGEVPKKSPSVAGMLSILPGAGYLYCERYQDALASFLVNGALILAAFESFDRDLPALGGLVSFVGAGFYAGNIYGSIGCAEKYNRAQTGRFIDYLKHNFHVGVAPAGRNGLGLALIFAF